MTDYTTYCPDSVLFERNPVCGVCWRVCKEMSEEWGGPIQFDLLASMEAADRLCQRLISNTWTLKGIEYYYHWLEAQLGFSRAAITCATATVCLSLRLMDDAPEPLQQMGDDMQGLLWGEGGELYDNMRCAARQQDIYLTATNYGEIPPDPNEEIKNKNYELTVKVNQLSQELQTMSKQINQYNIGTQYNGPVYNGCTFNDSHDTHYHGVCPTTEQAKPKEERTTETEQTDARYKKLFCNAFGDEDIQRTDEEKQRVQRYIADHNLGNRQLDSARDNPLNRMAVCFCAKWQSLRYVSHSRSVPRRCCAFCPMTAG